MKIPRPLYWHQGLFLQPQHFQLQDQAVESRLIPFLKRQGPHFWGIGGLEVDADALGAGNFSIESGSFLFQDGTYAEFPGNAVLKPRPLLGNLTEGQPLKVYVGIKKWSDAGKNVTVVDREEEVASASTRFVVFGHPDDVRDLHGNGPDVQVEQLHHLLRVFWGTEIEQAGDYLLIPLAKVEEFGGLQLSAHFIPPTIDIAASGALLKLIRQIRDQLAARIRQLEQYKKQRGVQNAEFGSRDMVYLLALRTLNRHVPLLFHFVEAPAVHPWAVYGALRQLIGEISSFSTRVNFLGEVDEGFKMLPPYDHKRLWECFSAAQDLVTQLLDDITAGPDYVVRLVNDGTYYAGDLKPSMLEGGSRYFLALKTQESPQFVQQSLQTEAKLSAREHLPLLTSHALPGLTLEYLPAPPQELPRRANTHYFAIDHRHNQWELVAKEHNIALNWNGAPADLEAEVMVVEKNP